MLQELRETTGWNGQNGILTTIKWRMVDKQRTESASARHEGKIVPKSILMSLRVEAEDGESVGFGGASGKDRYECKN